MSASRPPPPGRRWRLQFGLKRLLVVVVLLAIMIGALSGLLRPGPPWRMVDAVSDDLVRGAMGNVPLAEPLVTPLEVQRDPGETKVYLLLAVLGPIGLAVLLGLVWRAGGAWRWFWRQWGW
jgi:hypothetical protein